MPEPFTVDGLTERQRLFVRYYEGNASQAARKAGYAGTRKVVSHQGSEQLKNPRVRAAIQAKLDGHDLTAPEPPSSVEWRPQTGPQQQIAECHADIAIYGGAAGCGKSIALLYELAKWIHLRDYRGIIFRRTNPELTGGGGLWDESQKWYPLLKGRKRETPGMEWLFPSGARIEFRHLQHEEDVKAHHGRQYALVCFDELTTFTEKQFWYLVSRLRSTCGVRPYIRASCNPDPDSFVASLIAWWLDSDGYPIQERAGQVRWLVRYDDEVHWFDSQEKAKNQFPDRAPMSFTFVPGKLTDNQLGDPTYSDRLQNLATVDRLRLYGDGRRGGNWLVRASAGMILPRALFRIEAQPPSKIIRTVRCWDKGASAPTPEHPDPDWTRGVRVNLCEKGELWVDDLISCRERPAQTFFLMRKTAERDGHGVIHGLWQEVGGSGKVDNEVTQDALAGFPTETERIGVDKVAYAKIWAPLLERGMIFIKRAPWTEAIISECDGFPDGAHDDIVDAISRAALMLVSPGTAFWSKIAEAAKLMKGQKK